MTWKVVTGGNLATPFEPYNSSAKLRVADCNKLELWKLKVNELFAMINVDYVDGKCLQGFL